MVMAPGVTPRGPKARIQPCFQVAPSKFPSPEMEIKTEPASGATACDNNIDPTNAVEIKKARSRSQKLNSPIRPYRLRRLTQDSGLGCYIHKPHLDLRGRFQHC